ncbi:hypothetical protein HPP92_011244 [Vanilla planifolia]|uniref:Uncharacterized protein n=1 Tax=Vanilla planifolia TaxID=51239 RepID=A0A835V492_VANPL|nr:hypothetical protein HPP92_011244 [Vanilla planifolia]
MGIWSSCCLWEGDVKLGQSLGRGCEAKVAFVGSEVKVSGNLGIGGVLGCCVVLEIMNEVELSVFRDLGEGSVDLETYMVTVIVKMPKVKTSRVKYPEGWELIEPTLRELEGKMREAENDPHDGKRKCEALWPIFKISHQKSRYIYDLYYRRKEISKELYEFCLDQGYADRNLIAKWKKPGYERLCCLRCIQPRDHNFGTTCVCRVPKHLREEKVIECVHCGCAGCASGD